MDDHADLKAATSSNDHQLVPLKKAAFALALTPAGLRDRLIRLGKGERRGARWYVPVPLLEQMRAAQGVALEVLWGRKMITRVQKKPRHTKRRGKVNPVSVPQIVQDLIRDNNRKENASFDRLPSSNSNGDGK